MEEIDLIIKEYDKDVEVITEDFNKIMSGNWLTRTRS